MTKKPPARRESGTLTALCKTLKLSKRRVSELLTQGMPDDPQGAAEWRNARENDDSAAELRRRRIALLREQERLARIKADEADGLLLSRAEVEERDTQIGCALQAMFRRMELEIPALCYGKSSLGEMKEITKKEIRECQRIFSEGLIDFWYNHPSHSKKP